MWDSGDGDVDGDGENFFMGTWDTPLHVAAKLGMDAVCVALIDHGADLEEEDQEGNTPILLGTLVTLTLTVKKFS